VANPWRFAGGYFDSSTGLYKFGTRYYNPGFGRWSQQDPVRSQLNDPTSLNRYVYASDDPVNFTDPSGRISAKCFDALVLAFFEAIGVYAGAAWLNGLLWGFLGTVAAFLGADLLAYTVGAVLLGLALSSIGFFIAAFLLVLAVAAILAIFYHLEESHDCP